MLSPGSPELGPCLGGRAHTEASQPRPFGHGQTAVSGQRLPTSTAAQSQVASLSRSRRRVLVTQEKFSCSAHPDSCRLLWCPMCSGPPGRPPTTSHPGGAPSTRLGPRAEGPSSGWMGQAPSWTRSAHWERPRTGRGLRTRPGAISGGPATLAPWQFAGKAGVWGATSRPLRRFQHGAGV